jgi:protein TonB
MFPGGMTKFYEYVGKNMRYPREAKKNKANGRVFVEFVINADGSIDPESIFVLAGIHPACDEEAMRIVRESEAWIPGKINGEPVRQRFVLPFVFRY